MMGADTVANAQKSDSLRAALPDNRAVGDSSQNLQDSPGTDAISYFGGYKCDEFDMQPRINEQCRAGCSAGALLAVRRSRLSWETHVTNVYYHGLIMAQLCECSTETGNILYQKLTTLKIDL
jgi:hypothetical protein